MKDSEVKITTEFILDLIKKTEKELSEINLDSQTLLDICNDFISRQNELQRIAEMVSNTLMSFSRVHSVRHRVKDPFHLVEKIVRKKQDNSQREININNYLEEITDLVGVRALHLYKEAGHVIGKSISDTWKLKEDPIAYIRSGDSEIYTKQFTEKGCQVKEHKAGYRSLHYIIGTEPNKQRYFVEIQVRTIFEEGWSEIDHDIRYPDNIDNELINNFLQTLNRLSGSGDELGTFIRRLDYSLAKSELEYKKSLRESEEKIKDLQGTINNLSIKKADKDAINDQIDTIVKEQPKYASPYFDLSLYDPMPIGLSNALDAMRESAEYFAKTTSPFIKAALVSQKADLKIVILIR